MSDLTAAETLALATEGLRLLRDEALRYSDWTQMADSPLSDSDKASWASYRTYLRDLPASLGSDGILSFGGVQSFADWSA